MVRNNWLWAVIGLGLVACGGGSDDEDDMNPATGSTNGGTSGGGMTTGGSGGQTTGGTTGATTGGTTGGATTGGTTGGAMCPTPPVQQCTCTNGMMGIQTCMNGVFGECMCLDGLDAGPERPCPSGLTCQALGGGGGSIPGLPNAVCTNGMSPIPPMCMTDADCTTAGFVDVPCMSLGFVSLCVQACTP